MCGLLAIIGLWLTHFLDPGFLPPSNQPGKLSMPSPVQGIQQQMDDCLSTGWNLHSCKNMPMRSY
jgi:hypothetical protein